MQKCMGLMERLLLQLKTAVNERRIAHAYLLSGAEGCGKKTLSKIMSRMFLCPEGGCGRCPVCDKLEKGIHPDVIRLSGASKSGNYTMEPSHYVEVPKSIAEGIMHERGKK